MSEDLNDRIKRLRDQTTSVRHERKMDARYSRQAKMRDDIQHSGRFLSQAWQGILWLYEWVFQPIFRFLVLKARWIWAQYMKLWSLVVYRRTVDNVLLFSKTRAGLMILGSGIFAWWILFPWIILPLSECLLLEGPLYLFTAHVNEEVYLLGSQEINSHTGAHTIEGCKELPCDDQDAIYFRTDNSLFNNLWSLSHGRGVFFPEYVGAAVPYTTSKCTITSYGVRFRLTTRFMNIYPTMLSVSCDGGIKKEQNSHHT